MYCNINAVLQIITKLITIDRGYSVLPPNRRYSYLTEPLLQDTHGTQVIVLVFNMFIHILIIYLKALQVLTVMDCKTVKTISNFYLHLLWHSTSLPNYFSMIVNILRFLDAFNNNFPSRYPLPALFYFPNPIHLILLSNCHNFPLNFPVLGIDKFHRFVSLLMVNSKWITNLSYFIMWWVRAKL